MNDDRLTGLLGALRNERMDGVADDRIRARLETAWTARRQQRSFGFRLRRLAAVLATVLLLAGLGGATVSAAGDSPLYGVRVAVEDAAVALRATPEDRAEYLLSLLDERQAEAARLESSGNALAAGRVRQAEQNTLRVIQATLPRAPEVELPLATSTPTPTPNPQTPEPTVALTASPAASPPPTTPRPTTPTPTKTGTPKPTVPPTPSPSATPIAVTLMGSVYNADGTPADGVCVLVTTSTSGCYTKTTQGTYRVTVSARVGQTWQLYFTRTDGTILWKGTASQVVRGPTVQMPEVKLQK